MASSGNPIWNYFRRNEGTATCIVCMKELSLGSSLPKNQTVSSIKKHLEKVHPSEYSAFHALEQEYVQNKTQNVNLKRRAKRKRLKERKEAIEGPREKKKPGRKPKMDKYSETEDVEQHNTIEIIVQDPLEEIEEHPANIIVAKSDQSFSLSVEENKTPITRPGDIALSKRIDKSILDLLVVDMLPFSTVEGEAFKRLNIGDPSRPTKYVPKSQDYYRSTLMPETYAAVKKKVISSLEQAEWVTLTTTDWLDATKTCRIEVISAHFLHDNQKHMVVLHMSPQTTTSSKSNLLDLSRKFNIVEKVHVNVSSTENDDQSSAEWFSALQCSAFLLEKVIKEYILFGDSVEILKRKCFSIADHFDSNIQSMVNLHECQEICGLAQQKLLLDTHDSWTSTFLMWQRIYEQKPALELYTQQYGDLKIPSDYEWQQIENLLTILKILYQAWLDINSEAACASLVIPLLTMLNSKFEPKSGDLPEMSFMKQKLKQHLNVNFAFVHQTSFLIIATLLDPRFKMRYLTENQLASCHSEMKHNLRISLNIEDEESVMNPSFNSLPPTNNYKFYNTSDLWEAHDSSTIIASNNSSEHIFLAFEQQLSFYLKEPLIARNGNIYQYWNRTPYEYLRKLAYKYLTAPPTSLCAHETICNVATLYVERRLAALQNDDEDEKLLFMSCNIKLFNFEY
ncbi:zinc finger BED domain-containing protein 4-like [Musca vetustissima]|uniref:zinc finger BED domain-containing protein 4-like n=1 Tax=Musca vetustissima TaxID=27455 RepID=UPI002AB7503F|nr:zinc finger BED domain-containing protein 4-like [Musca vetustissima]